jgi:hypothetical protein
VKILNRPVKIWQAALVAAALALLAVTATVAARGVTSARSVVRDKGFSIPPNSIERGRVLCHASDGLALGGGAQVNDPKVEVVRDSYPWRDSDAVPRQDGWEVSVKNTGEQPLRAIVYATCG